STPARVAGVVDVTSEANCRASVSDAIHFRAAFDTNALQYPPISPLKYRLTNGGIRGTFHAFTAMKICSITGSRATRGSIIHRRGLAKKKGGVGRHITKMVPRIFAPNLQRHRIWVPELKKFVRIRVTARGHKTINKQGAYKALKK